VPRKHSIKEYLEDAYYHVYNRGVEKRTIYQDTQDYNVFLSYLKYALSKPPKPEDVKKPFKITTFKGLPFKGVPRLPKNFQKEIELVAYCLMPNHFHLLIKQVNKNSMTSFITSIITRYSMYFNKRHRRVGRLFQGPYKAIRIKSDEYLLHLSRYIHLNPEEHTDALEGAYSSYTEYLGKRKTKWIKPKIVLDFFNTAPDLDLGIKKPNTYKGFVESYRTQGLSDLGKLTLEEEEN
jgi:putative transposase